MSRTSFKIQSDDGQGERLDIFLRRKEPSLSRTRIQALIETGEVSVNGKVRSSSYKLSAADTVSWPEILPQKKPHEIDPVSMPLSILYEDSDILVINKNAGISVHPGAGTKGATLLHGLLAYTRDLSRINEKDSEIYRPGIVHRLDKDTSGAMVVAKNDAAHEKLAKQFSQKKLRRQYLGLTATIPPFERKAVISYLTRDKSDRRKFKSVSLSEYKSLEDQGNLHGKYRRAESYFWVERKWPEKKLSLLNIRITTGRTHQIRVHAESIGLSILGDPLYGEENKEFKNVSGQMLHAWILELKHPRTGKTMIFEAPLPRVWESDLLRREM